MTANRDFKRLVRTRMRKTGESYTSARRHFLDRKPTSSIKPQASSPKPASPDYAALAGMSDAKVKAATGCTWASWVKALDYAKAYDMSHRDIVKYAHDKFKTPSWWGQMVVVGYERIKGLREVGQRRGGTYEASRSKTFPVSVSRLYKACADKRRRSAWLNGAELTVSSRAANKSIRINWGDGSKVALWFIAKGKQKAVVSVQHARLPDKSAMARSKEYWGERLEALRGVLAPKQVAKAG